MAKKPTTTAIANWDEELAKAAQVGAALTQSSDGGKFFSTKAGVLAYDDAPLPGNQMVVIVLAHALENVYYEDKYDAENRAPPTCFAFCKNPEEIDEMEPHPDVDKEDAFERQHENCADCPHNQWGSAEKGRGKACGNRRRLALMPAGAFVPKGKGMGFEMELYEDPDHFKAADMAYLKTPVMSGKGFDSYVKQVAEQLRRPLWAVYTRVWLEPDAKSQFRVHFELIEPVDNSLLSIIKERADKAHEAIDFPYSPKTNDEDEASTAQSQRASAKLKRQTPAKAPVKRGRK